MNISARQPEMCAVVCAPAAAIVATALILGEPTREAPEASKRAAQDPGDSEGRVQRAQGAIARSWRMLGLDSTVSLPASATLVTLKADNTPYLSEKLLGRPLWHVVISGWSLKLKSYPPQYKDPATSTRLL